MNRSFQSPAPGAPTASPHNQTPAIPAVIAQPETVDITDEQGRNPGEPGFGDGDDGRIHSEEADPAPTEDATDTLTDTEI